MYTTQQYDDGSIYIGEVNERGQRHGQGTLKWEEDRYFTGKWSYDDPDYGTFYDKGYRYEGKIHSVGCFSITGQGTSYYQNGDIYVGSHYKGQPSCKGTMYYTNGDIEKGFWNDGRLSEGEYIYADGTSYKGQFLMVNGKNVMHKATTTTWDGVRYEGDLVNGKKDGQGIYYIYKKNIYYKGEFKENKFNGNGIKYFINGDIYEGNFKDDCMHGKGVATKAVQKIEGKWINNLLDGKVTTNYYFLNIKVVERYKEGNFIEEISKDISDETKKINTIILKNGNKYTGEVKNNKPNGIGSIFLEMDEKYYCNGNYINGKINGKGKMKLPDYEYTGDFQKGKINGKGIMEFFDSSRKIAGSFKNGIPHGFCQLINPISSVEIIEGLCYGSCFKGNARIIFKNRNCYYGEVKEYLPHGTGKMLYANGTMVIGNFKKGIPDGPVTILENNKKYDGHYKKGELIKKREWLLELKK